jgi:hypothetical protein
MTFVGSSFVTQQLHRPFFCTYFSNSFSAIYIIAYLTKFLFPTINQSHDSGTEQEGLSTRAVIKATAKEAMLFMPIL